MSNATTPDDDSTPNRDVADEAPATPSFHELRKRATQARLRIVRSRERLHGVSGLYTAVKPDLNGRGTDPDGEKAAAAAFASGNGMTLEELSKVLPSG